MTVGRGRKVRRAFAAAIALIGVAGCGTTANLSGLNGPNGPSGQAGNDGLAATTGSSAGGTSTPSIAASGGALSTSINGTSAATGGTSSTIGGTGPPSAASASTSTSTHGTISVGIIYALPDSAGLAAIGVTGLSNGNDLAYAQIVVDDANQHGGVGGRKVVPVYWGVNANPGAPSIPQQEQQACATFTEDHHVAIVIGDVGVGPLATCLAQHNIPLVAEGANGGIQAASFASDPLMYNLAGFNVDRRARAEVASLVQQKYFTPWNVNSGGPGNAAIRTAIVTYDQPDLAASAKGPLAAAIAAAGFGSPDVVEIAYHDSYGQLADDQTQVASALLRFKSEGISHVFIWDDNGIATLFFMLQAETQGFHPRYAVNTGNNMLLLTSKHLVSPQQVQGAVGIGWYPRFDVTPGLNPTGPYSNPARKACNDLLTAHGGTVSGQVLPDALGYCGEMAAIERAYRAAPDGSTAAIVNALDGFGTSFVNTLTLATYIAPGHHDGVAAYYQYVYSMRCSCMTYSGGPISTS